MGCGCAKDTAAEESGALAAENGGNRGKNTVDYEALGVWVPRRDHKIGVPMVGKTVDRKQQQLGGDAASLPYRHRYAYYRMHFLHVPLEGGCLRPVGGCAIARGELRSASLRDGPVASVQCSALDAHFLAPR